MSTTAIPTEQPEAEEEVREPVAKTAEARKMFKYSAFLDVGEGAQECEHSRDGECQDSEHFHAWIRLPNPFQHQDIREKATAAKARRIRMLKDPDSDASVILDEQLAQLDDPAFKESVIDELVAREWGEDYLEAQRDVDEREEFAHIGQDREEFQRRGQSERELSEEEQSDEYKHLTAHIASYLEAIRKRLEEIQQPKKHELHEREIQDVSALLRTKRVEDDGNDAFVETYNAWTWFIGTYKAQKHPTLGRPHLAMWDEIGRHDRPSAGTMFGEAPEVLDALAIAFNELQLALQQGSVGN